MLYLRYYSLFCGDPLSLTVDFFPRAKKRGLPQLGTLGAGNHYAEIQVVDEIFDKFAAGRMGIDRKGQVGLPFSRVTSF